MFQEARGLRDRRGGLKALDGASEFMGMRVGFFPSHPRFLRNARPQRRGKSPAEVLTGQTQLHWLAQLGYERFRRAA